MTIHAHRHGHPYQRSRGGWGRAVGMVAGVVVVGILACSPPTDEAELPPDVDPAPTRTRNGALAAYDGALALFKRGVDSAMVTGGLLTDELTMLGAPIGFGEAMTPIDLRQLPAVNDVGPADEVYSVLQKIRGQVQEARGLLAAFAPDVPAALPGHLSAVEGYAEVYLADLFCSEIPLSTVDFDADYTLAPGSTTQVVYEHALALFETALPLVGDNALFLHLAEVGRERALLALGRYAEAAAAVAAVPDAYQYQVVFQRDVRDVVLSLWNAVDGLANQASGGIAITLTMPEFRETVNGLDFRASSDPRTASTVVGQNSFGSSMYYPTKYPLDSPAALSVASGVEARLIEAEAALQAGGDWLARLNALRTTGTFDTQPNANDPNQTDTLWHAGTGGVAGLHPLEDPGSVGDPPSGDDASRVDLLFRERAFWLYLTAHRQGDLRRLVRQYERSANTLYPIGSGYPGGNGQYGDDVTLPVPAAERAFNPLYTGCEGRNA